jgi:hypothetical protein
MPSHPEVAEQIVPVVAPLETPLDDGESSKTPQRPATQTEPNTCARLSIGVIARRLSIGKLAVYAMLEQRIIPGVRIGKRWIVTRYAYENWERTCGMQAVPAKTSPEVH